MPADTQLRHLLAKWDELRDRGEELTPEDLCRDCPERVAEVRALLRDLLPLAGHLLQVSGRMSFEIVEKAYLAGIPCVAGVSGVSSLALELALACGVTLVGFVRDGGFTVYAHAERVVDAPAVGGAEARRKRSRGQGAKRVGSRTGERASRRR